MWNKISGSWFKGKKWLGSAGFSCLLQSDRVGIQSVVDAFMPCRCFWAVCPPALNPTGSLLIHPCPNNGKLLPLSPNHSCVLSIPHGDFCSSFLPLTPLAPYFWFDSVVAFVCGRVILLSSDGLSDWLHLGKSKREPFSKAKVLFCITHNISSFPRITTGLLPLVSPVTCHAWLSVATLTHFLQV